MKLRDLIQGFNEAGLVVMNCNQLEQVGIMATEVIRVLPSEIRGRIKQVWIDMWVELAPAPGKPDLVAFGMDPSNGGHLTALLP